MVRPRNGLASLRLSRLDKTRLLLALLISLLAHLGVWGGYEAGKKFGLWQKLHWPARHPPVAKLTPVSAPKTEPTIYLDVAQADTEAPKQAKYYSDKNARAANPDAATDSNQPKLNGKQRDVPKTEDAPRTVKAKSATPTPPQKETDTQPAEPKPAGLNAGNSQSGKPADQSHPDNQLKPRPRTVREALAQQEKLPGLQMQQEGGVKRIKLVPSFDATATQFGQYDARVFDAIQQYWNDELEKQQYAGYRAGRVTITFDLNYDGSVSHVQILKSDVDILFDSYCQESIEQTAPYGKWPDEMLHIIGSTKRPMKITFIYY